MGEEAIARSMVAYNLKDPFYVRESPIQPSILLQDAYWWRNTFHASKEWTVLRKTGVSSDQVYRTFQTLDTKLMTFYPIMLDLQAIWYTATLPQEWGEGFHFDVTQRPYNTLHFTDLRDLDPVQDFPMTTRSFVSRIEKRVRNVTSALSQVWSQHVLSHVIDFVHAVDASFWGESPFSSQLQQQQQQQQQGLSILDQLIMEEEKEREGHPNSLSEDASAKIDRLSILLNAINTHMSLQVRSLCEVSLQELASFFESYQDLDAHGGSIFTLSVSITNEGDEEEEEEEDDDFEVLSLNRGRSRHTQQHGDDEGEGESLEGVNNQEALKNAHDLDITSPLKVVIHPPLSTLKKDIRLCLLNMIKGTFGLEALDEPILESIDPQGAAFRKGTFADLRLAQVNEEETIVQEVKDRIFSVIEDLFEFPERALNKYKPFQPLFDGSLLQEVEDAIAFREEVMEQIALRKERQGEEEQEDEGEEEEEEEPLGTRYIMDRFTELITKLTSLDAKVDSFVQDTIHFRVFSLDSSFSKKSLHTLIEKLKEKLSSCVLEDNRSQLTAMNGLYQTMSTRLMEEPISSTELKELHKYTKECKKRLVSLYDEYQEDVLVRILFLQEHNFKIPRDEFHIFNTCFHWPQTIQEFIKRSQDMYNEKKVNLEELLEEDISKLEEDLSSLAKSIESIASNPQIDQFRKIVDRLEGIEKELEEKEEKAYDIEENEALLEVPTSHPLERVQSLQTTLQPLNRLWHAIQSFIESSHEWHQSPLTQVNSEEAERKTDELLAELYAVSKALGKSSSSSSSKQQQHQESEHKEELEEGQGGDGDDRNTAKSVAEQMQREIKDFI
jgi:hypothetical protein